MRRDRCRDVRPAFTLIEVVVAMAIGGLAVTIAAVMLRTAGDHARLISAEGASIDASANAVRRVRQLVAQMAAVRTGDAPRRGSWDEVAFHSWCATPGGWQERCRVVLAIHDRDGVRTLTLAVADRTTPIALTPGPEGFVYLPSIERGVRWSERWVDVSAMPAAIGLAFGTDTLIWSTGAR